METVDFFMDCWERDYRHVLAPDQARTRAEACMFPFRQIVVTVNNVQDEADARQRAANALRRRDVDRVVFVSDEIARALHICGLTQEELGGVFYFTNFLLVTVTCSDARYIVHFGGEVAQDRHFNWISPALERMQSDRRFLIANPAWATDPQGARREATAYVAPHFVGQGFSDQCFLVERARLAADIYHYRHPASARFPLSEVGDSFEKRIDAFMRTNRLLRLTDPRVQWIHHGVTGEYYPTAKPAADAGQTVLAGWTPSIKSRTPDISKHKAAEGKSPVHSAFAEPFY